MHTAIGDSCRQRKVCRAGPHDRIQHRDLKLELCRARDHTGNGMVCVRERHPVRDSDIDQWPAMRADAVAVRRQVGIPNGFCTQRLLRPDQVTSADGQTFSDTTDCGFERFSVYDNAQSAIAQPRMCRRRRQQLIPREQECTLPTAETLCSKRLRKRPPAPTATTWGFDAAQPRATSATERPSSSRNRLA